MAQREYRLLVKVIREGQPRPYADSEYEYEIEAEGCNEYTVKEFCTSWREQVPVLQKRAILRLKGG